MTFSPVLARVALEHDLEALLGRRAALALRLRIEGLGLREIAEASGLSVSGAHAAVQRALVRWPALRSTIREARGLRVVSARRAA